MPTPAHLKVTNNIDAIADKPEMTFQSLLDAGKQLGQADVETIGDHFEIEQAHIALAEFNFVEITSIYS